MISLFTGKNSPTMHSFYNGFSEIFKSVSILTESYVLHSSKKSYIQVILFLAISNISKTGFLAIAIPSNFNYNCPRLQSLSIRVLSVIFKETPSAILSSMV